jgi:hypothetical protein
MLERVAMTRKVAQKRARVARIGMQFRTQDSIRAVNSQENLRGDQHAKQRGGKVKPSGSPNTSEDCRTGCASRIDAEA